jgi:hypothetical protein
MGSPQYMSPEQGRAEKRLDFRSDIYSLGCVLFHMLTGRPPYEADTTAALIFKHVHEPPPDIRAVLPNCPTQLVSLLDWMMAKTPAARPESYEALIRKLYRARNSLTLGPPSPKATAATPGEVAITLVKRAPAVRQTMVLVAAGLAAVAALAAGLFWWSSSRVPQPAATALAATNPPAPSPSVTTTQLVAVIPATATTAVTSATAASPPEPTKADAAKLRHGLVAYYPMDDDARDHSGQNNHGSAQSVVFATDPQRGRVCHFNGSNAFISVPPKPSLEVTGPITFAAWINPEETDFQRYILFKAWRSAGYTLYISDGAFRFELSARPLLHGKLPVQQWTHVAGVYDGTNLTQYINGEQVNKSLAAPLKNSSTKLYIGCWSMGPTTPPARWFHGSMDEVRIYARALLGDEIKALYSLTQAGSLAVDTPPATTAAPSAEPKTETAVPPPLPQLQRELVAYYPMDGDARDHSGQGHHGMAQAVTFTHDAQRGQVGFFNGDNAYIRVTRSPALEFTGPFTLAAWINPHATDGWRTILIKKFNIAGYSLYLANALCRFEVAGKRGETGELSGRQWTHVAGIYDGTNLLQYINGVKANILPGGVMTNSATDLCIGCWSLPGQPRERLFKGYLDDVRLYARALSNEEIKALYSLTKAGSPSNDLPATITIPPAETAAPAAGTTDVKRGLVAYYPLAGDARDYSGHTNHGTARSLLFPTDPMRGKVCRFNGTDSYIRVPRSPSLEFAGSFTLTAWVCPDETDKVRAIIAKEFNFSGYQLCVHNGAVSFSLAHKGGITGKLPVRQWTQVAGVFDGTNVMQYVNGKLMNTIESNISRHSRTDLHLGCWIKPGQPPSRLFKGDMADIRIYARALSGEELMSLYALTKSGKPAPAAQ